MRRDQDQKLPVIIAVILAAACLPALVSAAGTETLISTGLQDSHQLAPSTWGDYIAWENQDIGSGSTARIMLLNTATGRLRVISSPDVNARSPRVQGNSVVWMENIPGDMAGNTDIYHLNIQSNITRKLTGYPAQRLDPVVFANRAVWVEREGLNMSSGLSYYDLQMVDLADPSRVTNITPHPGKRAGVNDASHMYPSIWGSYVAWEDYDDVRKSYEIFVNDTATGTLYQISDDGGLGFTKRRPAVSGSRVVWTDYRNPNTIDIFSDTIPPSGNTNLTPFGDSSQILPALHGTTLAWLDNRVDGIHFQVAMENLSSHAEVVPVSPANRALGRIDIGDSPSVFRNRVVWSDSRIPGGYDRIYLYTDGVPVTCPVASFTHNSSTGAPPFTVRFTDTSGPADYHAWDFGDGTTSFLQNPEHTYTENGTFPVVLTVGSSYCRNATSIDSSHTISVGERPVVDFTAAPGDGIAPLTVSFSGTATGSPYWWNWSFGDGTFSTEQNPVHTYLHGGVFNVTFKARNQFGTGFRKKINHIVVKKILASDTAITHIPGISIVQPGMQLSYNTAVLPAYTIAPDGSALISVPPAFYGWQNITFHAGDAAGFVQAAGNVTGTLSTSDLTTRDIIAAGANPAVGTNLQTNYRLSLDGYQKPGWLATEVWEGATPTDDHYFLTITTESGYTHYWLAYTVNTTRTGLGSVSGARINMSVGSGWRGEAQIENIAERRNMTHVIAIGYDPDGNLTGTVLPARFLFNDTVSQLEYFEAVVPSNRTFLTKYTLAMLAGTGNIGQLITLSVTSHANQPSARNDPPADQNDDSGSDGVRAGAAAGVAAAPAATLASVPPDPGRSAKVYTNANGVVTQATSLRSTDGSAIVYLGEGIVATDAGGKPLAVLSIRAVPAGALPPLPPAFPSAVLAYDIGPDGAGFAPPASITFTPPEARWGAGYAIQSYDRAAGTWQDLPATFNATTGTVTANLPHLCIVALFIRQSPGQAAPASSLPDVPAVTPVPPDQPPSSAVSVFASMMAWAAGLLADNTFIVLIAFILGGVAYLIQQGKFPGSGQ